MKPSSTPQASTLSPKENGLSAMNNTGSVARGPVMLSTDNLTKEYRVGRKRIKAVANISLEIQRGEFVALVGASGSGKSTLLQLLGGLDTPTSGDVTVDGQLLRKMSDRKLSIFRNRTIGFIFQLFYLQPFLTVRRNIEIAAMPQRKKRRARKDRTQIVSEWVGLTARLDHLPQELSGGQIQRAAIARALFNQPSVILADEPTGNLDPQNSREVINLFLQLRDTFGTTILIATHSESIAAQADRIVTLQDGELI